MYDIYFTPIDTVTALSCLIFVLRYSNIVQGS